MGGWVGVLPACALYHTGCGPAFSLVPVVEKLALLPFLFALLFVFWSATNFYCVLLLRVRSFRYLWFTI